MKNNGCLCLFVLSFSANGMSDPANSSVGSATSPKLEPPPSPHANRKKHRRKKSTGITKPDGVSAGNEGTRQLFCYSFEIMKTSETLHTLHIRLILLYMFLYVVSTVALNTQATSSVGKILIKLK